MCFQPLFKLSLVILALILAPGCCQAEEITSASGISLGLDAGGGAYRLTIKKPAWDFGGSLKQPLKDVAARRGSDGLGGYQLLDFKWQDGNTPMSGEIRLYDEKPLALFSQTCRAATSLLPPFPDFRTLPANLHVFSYGHHEFAPPHFAATEISTPWLLFDTQDDALVISPASHYMVASMLGDGREEVASGFNPSLRNLPPGFTQQTLVAFGQGINRTWNLWGSALLDLHHSKRPANDADTVLKYLGYWTDNGATYYYNYDTKGYAGTLESLVDRYRQEQIPIRYLQLDSWWYYKSTTEPTASRARRKRSTKLPDGRMEPLRRPAGIQGAHQSFPERTGRFPKIHRPAARHAQSLD